VNERNGATKVIFQVKWWLHYRKKIFQQNRTNVSIIILCKTSVVLQLDEECRWIL